MCEVNVCQRPAEVSKHFPCSHLKLKKQTNIHLFFYQYENVLVDGFFRR